MAVFQQRHCQIWGANLLFLTMVLGGVANFLDRNGVFDGSIADVENVKTVLVLVLIVGIIFAVRKGYLWAKVLVLFIYITAAALFAYFHFTTGRALEFNRKGVSAGLQLVQWVLEFLAFLLIVRSLKRDRPLAPQAN
jgi:lysylphosphatidylglycerol synthetase-like protein (DUF2156 family)